MAPRKKPPDIVPPPDAGKPVAAPAKPPRKKRRPDSPATEEDRLLAANLATLIKERGISGRELSRRADVSLDTARNIIVGRSTSPRARTLQALADVLGVPLSALYGGAPPPTYVSVQLTQTVTIPELSTPAHGMSPLDGNVAREWAVPEDALAGIAPEHLRIVVAPPGQRPYGIQTGDRLVVDTSRREPHPPGTFVIVDDRGAYLAHVRSILNRKGKLMVTRGEYTDQTEVDSVRIAGRVVARWTLL